MSAQPPVQSDAAEATLKIGQVADRVGLSLRTLRYYEEVGLLEPAGRTAGGFRLYSEDDVARLAFLKGMKPFGLSLEEIRELVDLLEQPADAEDAAAEGRLEALRGYLERADARLLELEAHTREVLRVRSRIASHLEASGASGRSIPSAS